ncbi:MAG: hypothetical protein SGARI_007998, partial [Bacillariaceae sp.]
FYDQSGASPSDGYNAKAVRAKGKGGKKYNDLMAKGGGGGGAKRTVSSSTRTTRPVPAPRTTTTKTKPQPTTRSTTAVTKKKPLKPNSSENKSNNNTTNKASSLAASAQADAQLLKKNVELENKVRDMETTIAEIEKERDFYFGKLRNVELMLQVKQDKNYEECEIQAVVDSIFKVLYATADEDVAVDEEGELSEALNGDIASEEPEETPIPVPVEEY